jgi:hypothetical protein
MTKQKKKKIGRNDPCPCGSGVKYKKCHCRSSMKPQSSSTAEVKAIMELHKAKEALRQSQQGQGNPIISTEFQGYRFTAVGNMLHYAKTHRTFIDFLGDYIRTVFSPEWGDFEISKPLEDRHQILKWYDGICALQRSTMNKPYGEIQIMPTTGLVAAYFGLAYNLYLLQHNVELQTYLIQRLKMHDSFYSAYYETYVAAWFILAGFKLRLENEQDSTRTHPEFIATRRGENYSVEAKTRQPGKNHFDVGNQLYKGLNIEAHHPRVIFIDMNVSAEVDCQVLVDEAFEAIRCREPKMTVQGNPAPAAHVFVTNQPYHLALDKTHLPRICFTAGFKIPDFGDKTRFWSYTEAYKARIKYVSLYDVRRAMINYSIPSTFDGEIPEFAFGQAKRRFTIGEHFEMADGMPVTLQSGIVVESEHKAYLVLNDEKGMSHIITVELSDAELAAYRAHPETFFGRIKPVSKNTNDPMDLYTFFIEANKKLPKEKLLKFMGNAPDIEELKRLPDNELRYIYAERLTYWAINKSRGQKTQECQECPGDTILSSRNC